MLPFICFTVRVTTLAGGSQGYKDGTGQEAKFHHTAGETIIHYEITTSKRAKPWLQIWVTPA